MLIEKFLLQNRFLSSINNLKLLFRIMLSRLKRQFQLKEKYYKQLKLKNLFVFINKELYKFLVSQSFLNRNNQNQYMLIKLPQSKKSKRLSLNRTTYTLIKLSKFWNNNMFSLAKLWNILSNLMKYKSKEQYQAATIMKIQFNSQLSDSVM